MNTLPPVTSPDCRPGKLHAGTTLRGFQVPDPAGGLRLAWVPVHMLLLRADGAGLVTAPTLGDAGRWVGLWFSLS